MSSSARRPNAVNISIEAHEFYLSHPYPLGLPAHLQSTPVTLQYPASVLALRVFLLHRFVCRWRPPYAA